MSRKPNPAIRDYCRSCLGWGFYLRWKDPDDEEECIDCGGTGKRRQEGQP